MLLTDGCNTFKYKLWHVKPYLLNPRFPLWIVQATLCLLWTSIKSLELNSDLLYLRSSDRPSCEHRKHEVRTDEWLTLYNLEGPGTLPNSSEEHEGGLNKQ